MRKSVAIFAAALACSLALVCRADTYVGSAVLDWDPAVYSSGYGGELQAHLNLTAGPYVIASQSHAAEIGGNSTTTDPSNPVFQTFCIQEGVNNVDAIPGQLYAAVIGTTAQTHTSPPPETLNPITQVLYAEFWNGTLPGYNYAPLGGARIASAGQLQDAIWVAQGDNTFGGGMGEAGISNIVLAQLWYNAAADYVLHGTIGAYLGDVTGADRVMVLGLYDTPAHALAGGTTGIAQAQLVEVAPVPLPPALWSGLGLLGGVGVYSTWKRRQQRATA